MGGIIGSKDIGWQLKKMRQQAGLTQERLAELISVSPQQIQKYESGADKMNTDRLQQLAAALSVPVQAFFSGAEAATPLSVSEKILLESFRAISDQELQKCLLKFAAHAAKAKE